MLDYILKHFSCDSKFINDLEGVNNYLTSLNLNETEYQQILTNIYEYNQKIYLLMKQENKELETVMTKPFTSDCVLYKDLASLKDNPVKKEDSIITLELDVRKLLSRIRTSKTYEDIKNILPVKGSLNYNHIINSIILGLYEDIMDYKKLLISDRGNMSAQDLKDAKTEIRKLQLKINYLKKLNSKTLEPLETIEKEPINTLLFLKTASGNYSIFSDLKDIPSENYNWFYILLTAMMENNFKKFKRFGNNENITGMMEVKYNKARIIFVCVGKNKYVILDMFIKKVDNDAAYQASLENKHDLFEENYPTINNLMFNDNYLAENRKVLDNILSTLSQNNKVKKIGDLNE